MQRPGPPPPRPSPSILSAASTQGLSTPVSPSSHFPAAAMRAAGAPGAPPAFRIAADAQAQAAAAAAFRSTPNTAYPRPPPGFGAPATTPGAAAPSAARAAPIDMSDFPALGANMSASHAHAQAQQQQQQQQQQAHPGSYASQAGTAPGGGASGGSGGGASSSASSGSASLYGPGIGSLGHARPGHSSGGPGAGAGAAPGTSLSSDDFPALSAAAAAAGAPGTNSAHVQSAADAAGEQASAAAALRAQLRAREQHREALIEDAAGNQNRGVEPLNAARGGFGDAERNYATKPGMPSASLGWANGSLLSDASLSSLSAMPAAGGGAGSSNGAGTGGAVELATPAAQILHSPADRFGLLGLLGIIKMADPDMSMLAMGSDLQALGLGIEGQDALYSHFITPWADNNLAAALHVEPDFHLPSCYNVQPPPPAASKVANFTDETLFYIFYSAPRDLLQEVAAQELHQRNWRFHRELQLWLTQHGEPSQKTPTYERGTYLFFDPRAWEKVSKEFVLMYELLEEKAPLNAAAAAAAGLAPPPQGTQTSQSQPSAQQSQQGQQTQQSQGQQQQSSQQPPQQAQNQGTPALANR